MIELLQKYTNDAWKINTSNPFSLVNSISFTTTPIWKENWMLAIYHNLRYADDNTVMTESGEELKSLLMKLKEESEKLGIKLNAQKTKIMTSGLITSLQIDGEKVETVKDFILGVGAPKSLQMVTATTKLKDTCSLRQKL